MTTLSFLAILPAALAVTGFVIYRFLGAQKESSRITSQIVEKLRADMPERSSQLENLPARQVSIELTRDHALRSTVGEKNFALLQLVLLQEHKRSLVVYGICAGLFLFGMGAFVYLQARPQPLIVDGWHLESVDSRAKGLAVDLDDLRLSWKAAGPQKDVTVVLENIQTGRRTEPLNVNSGTGSVVFEKDALTPLLTERQFKKNNRVRSVMTLPTGDVVSAEFPLHVGMRVMALPDPGEKSLTIAALIDNRLVQGYAFEGKALTWRRKAPVEPRTWGGPITAIKKFMIADFEDYDWPSLKMVYMGFDDLRTIRCEPVGL
ncbi:hypothetical protein [Prosthecobacter sp.]|uniref:hypothetical protein n=1 Tax=Prosthecobacter sp. TaxID=1965333 RepID=UPI00248833A0|nr:hypothetical protein [Prosthecobacter sp.]MDI1313364.1 hypothetical protein [Prosthecobacter sp.]